MMKIFHNKRSSLEMSIRTIVVIVLALTLLGLGLGFIRNMIGDISDTTSTIQDQIRQQILEDLRRGDKKLSFPTSEVKIENGDSKVLAVGIKNNNAVTLNFHIELYDVTNGQPTAINNSDIGTFIWDVGNQTLNVNDANVFPLKLTAGNNEETFIIKIIVWDDISDKEYASKSFFVTIT